MPISLFRRETGEGENDAGGTRRLRRRGGPSKAGESIFTGDIISADEAHRIGLVNRAVDSPAQLIPPAKETAAKIPVSAL